VATGKELQCFRGHTGIVEGVAFSPDARLAATCGVDASVRLWDLQTGQEVRRFPGHSGPVRSVAYSPDGKRLLTGGQDMTVRLWDVATGQELCRLRGHTAVVWSVAFSPDGRRALSGSADRTLRLWQLPGEWVSLFNGEDLTGWKPMPAGVNNWRVVKGLLTGSGHIAPTHLLSARGDYEDFHVRAEARVNDGGNSGLYFRAGSTIQAWGCPAGYEAQINSTHPDPIRTGSLYGFGPRATVTDMLVKPNEWFTLEVLADGNHLVIKVNGKTTVDFVDEKNTHRKGHFALQQFTDRTGVQFRKIEVLELPRK
jgi:WD40 repeat protein